MAINLKKFILNLTPRTISQPKQTVGIDFGSSSVKVVELEQKENIPTLKTYGELQLGPYAKQPMGSVVRMKVSQQTEALVDVLRESNVVATTGVMSLQLSSSFVTILSLTAQEHEDLGPRVRIEARKYIPVPMADVTLDWSELPTLGTEPSTVKEVLVAAVQNESNLNAHALLSAIKMHSQPTEIEIFSTLRALSKTADTSVAILDLGAQTSKLYITHQGVVRKIHRVFAGGSKATDRISKVLSLSFEEAENKKRNYTETDAHAIEIKKAVVNTFERPLQEFKRVLNQYEMRSGSPVSRIVITGGSSSFVEMQTYVNYMFGRTVERANPFTKVAYPAFMEDTLAEIAPAFSVALGAALRPFDVPM